MVKDVFGWKVRNFVFFPPKIYAMNRPILFLTGLLWLILAGCGGSRQPSPSEIRHHAGVPTQDSLQRKLDVYLPPGYADRPDQRYPVVYLFDGQALFHPDSSKLGAAWEIDELLDSLISGGHMEPCVVAGFWSTPRRIVEYMPGKGFEQLPDSLKQLFMQYYAAPESDWLLKILVEDIVPFVNKEYRTKADPGSTIIGGSGSGGLMALYAISEYPEVFGGAICMSTHWPLTGADKYPAATRIMVEAMGAGLPDPQGHKIYFDYGTVGGETMYEPYQQQMDFLMEQRGYVQDRNWVTRKIEGGETTPQSWGARFYIPLQFMLSGKSE